MQNDLVINEELKELLLSDKEIEKYFLIALLHNVYKTDNPKEHELYYYSEYQLYESILNGETSVNGDELKTSLLSVFKKILSYDLIDDVLEDYKELAINGGKLVISSLSRLLYFQDKHKKERIGQEIDNVIKTWRDYAREVSLDTKKYTSDMFKSLSDDEKDIFIEKIDAYNLYDIIPSLNYDIYKNDKNRVDYKARHKFIDLWDLDHVKAKDLKDFILTYIKNTIIDCENYDKYHEIINTFINNLEDDENIEIFKKDQEKEIQAIKDKHNVKNDYNITLSEEEKEHYLEELSQAYTEWQKYNGYDIQTSYDISKWHEQADKFINHLLSYDKDARLDLFNMDYMLDYLAYNKYQKETYKSDNIGKVATLKVSKTKEKKKNLSKKELIEKYKDITTLKEGEILNDKKGWALVDTNKTNNKILNMREIIGKKVDNNTDITDKKINDLKKKKRPTKADLKAIEELEELKKEQEENQQNILDEVKELRADYELITKVINKEQNANEVKRLNRQRNKIDKQIKEKEKFLHNEGVYFQLDVFSNKLVYEKTDKKTKESYKLMINTDYDVQNFNQEGRNFLQYIPNIDNVVNELNNDYITIDLDHYVDFNGLSNPSRTRQNLLKTLTEMRKESYEYSYKDNKGVLQEGSLVLVGDVMTTEYKGKATLKVQLGGQFKRNIQNSIINGQIAHVNKDVFKLGHGNKNKREYRAKELYLYFVRLARTEAKKGLIKGTYEKALKVSTIIDYLIDINEITYNPNRYSECVKEPLQVALYTGQELGLYEIETDAFMYYDNVISALNNGANNKEKVKNFENQLIKIKLYNDNTDLEKNKQAYDTYKTHRKKATKK